MKIELYQEFNEKEILEVLKFLGKDRPLPVPPLELQEIKDEENDLFGDFLLFEEYGFKKVYDKFICLITPTEHHTRQTVNISSKASGDRGKNYFTRYKSKHGGKEAFNPVSKTGNKESIKDTKRRLGL
jgi:hypothetical protein